MKKVLLVSKNKRVIENITMVFNASIHSEFCLLSLSRYENIGEDINEFGANIIVIDMTGGKQAEIQNSCKDDFNTTFSSYQQMQDYHEQLEKNSQWKRSKISDLSVVALSAESPLLKNLGAFAAGTSAEAVEDTAQNLGLAIWVDGKLYPVRMTAYKSEYSVPIEHSFQEFRALLSGKAVHAFPV